MKTIIIYKSKTGFARRYAGWLVEDLGCEAVPYNKRGTVDLGGYDTVILAGGLYAGMLAGMGWLKQQLPALEGKKVAALAVGATPAESPELAKALETCFSAVPSVRGFYCQGGLDYERMGVLNRMVLTMLRGMLKNQPEQAEMMDVLSTSFDAADRKYLEPVLAWARG